MSDSIQATLRALKDVQGIHGSFILNGEGTLLALEMPSLFDASMFVELGPRIGRLAECFAELGDELESCMIRFADHLLCVKQFAKGGALCILTSRTVNLPALKMAVNLAHRRVAGEIATAEPLALASPAAVVTAPAAPVEPPPAAVQAAAPVEPAPAPAAEPQQVERKVAHYYRGHLVED